MGPSNRNFCYKCGSSKHFAKECTKYPQQEPPYTRCSHCGLLHKDRFCKDKRKRSNLENKNTRNREALPDPDIPVHHTLDNKPMRKIEHTKFHTKIKEKTDLAAIPTLEALL